MGDMPTVRLATAIRRQVEAGPADVAGPPTREAIESYFVVAPQAQLWVLDDLDHPWPHVALFVDGKPVADRTTLEDPLQPDSVIEIWPALSE